MAEGSDIVDSGVLRRSQRSTRGKPPVRYGCWDMEELGAQAESRTEYESVVSSASSGSASVRRLRIEAALDAEKKFAALAEERAALTAENRKRIIEMEWALRRAEIDEMAGCGDGGNGNSAELVLNPGVVSLGGRHASVAKTERHASEYGENAELQFAPRSVVDGSYLPGNTRSRNMTYRDSGGQDDVDVCARVVEYTTPGVGMNSNVGNDVALCGDGNGEFTMAGLGKNACAEAVSGLGMRRTPQSEMGSARKPRRPVPTPRMKSPSAATPATPASANSVEINTLRRQFEQQEREFRAKERAYQERLYHSQTPSTPSQREPLSADGDGRKESTGVEAAISKLAEVMASTLQKVGTVEKGSTQSSGNSEMKQFVARQAMAKELPTFSGDPQEWQLFYQQFRTSTEACGFSNAENMARLQRCLKGKARETVQSLLSMPDSLDEVVRTLETRFGRPDYIVQTLINKAKQTSPVREGDLVALVDFSNSVRNLVSTMESLDSTGHLRNPQLRQELVDKLPGGLRLQWGEHVMIKSAEDVVVDMKTLAEWLHRRANAASLVNASQWAEKAASSSEKQVKPVPRWRSRDPTSGRPRGGEATLTTVQAQVAALNETANNCDFCGKRGHGISSCYAFKAKGPDERREWALGRKLCFQCLKSDHVARQCQNREGACKRDGCSNRRHHKLLHVDPAPRPPPTPETVAHSTNGDIGVADVTQRVLLRVVPVKVYGSTGVIDTFALLDEASTVSLVSESLSDRLGLVGEVDPLHLRWTSDISQRDHDSRRVDMQISSVNGVEKFVMKDVHTMRDLALPAQTIQLGRLQSRWKHLRDAGVGVRSMTNVQPQILIGQDNCHLIISREVVEGPPNAPVLSRTKLGWVLHGNQNLHRTRVDSEFTLHVWRQEANADEILGQIVKESFSTESFGVSPPKEKLRSRQEERASTILEERTTYLGNRWQSSLLWKSDDVVFPESRHNAWKRLRSVERRMDREPEFAAQYCEKVDSYVTKGYAHQMTSEEMAVSEPKWYLPHFGVTNQSKPGKLRLVFDAAAKSHGTCLNDLLLSGPDLLSPLNSVLLKFRQYQVGFAGDIKEMFHQVQIIPEDTSAQCFLWRGMDRDREPDVIRMDVMIFGATSSPSTAQYVKNRNAREHLEMVGSEVVRAIERKHYVDDYLDSCPTVEEAIAMVDGVSQTHSKGGFTIRNWVSNSRAVLRHIPEDARARGDIDLDLASELPIERTLGLKWNTEDDCFLFTVNARRANDSLRLRSPTKREVLRRVMSIFDPLGFLACFIVRAKILIQEIWRARIGWDDELPTSLQFKWQRWCDELQEIGQFRIPRWYGLKAMNDGTQIELHVFCDASENAFAAVAYLRVSMVTDTENNKVTTPLVCGKTRVAPLKPMSIPRLELQAAVMGSRLANTLAAELEVYCQRTVLWSDSQTVLWWLYSDARRYKSFVAHRVGEILETTEQQQWRWVPTKMNVADDATRGMDASQLAEKDCRWVHGPSWLQKPENEWPTAKTSAVKPVDDPELKSEFVGVATDVSPSSALPDTRRFSSYRRLLRTTAWVLRFVHVIRQKVRRSSTARVQRPLYPRSKQRRPASSAANAKVYELTVDELNRAETLLLRRAQAETFPADLDDLRSGRAVSPSSRLYQLSPMLADEDKLIRMKGRIKDETVSLGVRQPVLLDPQHPTVRLIIMEEHKRQRHHGMQRVMNELRQRFWILSLRAAVRRAFNDCQTCKNARAKPHNPEMAPIPSCRLAMNVRAFTETGVDYFGPMAVTVRRRQEKRYGVLFTCLTTRAVHLEIAPSLTTDSAVMAIRRMVCRRGNPKRMYSDNGTNLRGAESTLRRALQEMDQNQLLSQLAARGIEWNFNPPQAPHMGGAWERLVRSIKVALAAILKERAPQVETLETALLEAESIVNSRPLTDVSLDEADSASLTPNHFLLGTSSPLQPPGTFSDRDLCLRRQWRISQRLADHFWARWIKEYLPTLTRRTKWHRQQKRQIRVDDVVIIADSQLPRGCWPKGVVEAVYPGRDGVIRVADVRTKLGTFRRPVVKLCVLDVTEGN